MYFNKYLSSDTVNAHHTHACGEQLFPSFVTILNRILILHFFFRSFGRSSSVGD